LPFHPRAWRQCYTQQEIAERVGVHKDTVSEILDGLSEKVSENQIRNTPQNFKPLRRKTQHAKEQSEK